MPQPMGGNLGRQPGASCGDLHAAMHSARVKWSVLSKSVQQAALL